MTMGQLSLSYAGSVLGDIPMVKLYLSFPRNGHSFSGSAVSRLKSGRGSMRGKSGAGRAVRVLDLCALFCSHH